MIVAPSSVLENNPLFNSAQTLEYLPFYAVASQRIVPFTKPAIGTQFHILTSVGCVHTIGPNNSSIKYLLCSAIKKESIFPELLHGNG